MAITGKAKNLLAGVPGDALDRRKNVFVWIMFHADVVDLDMLRTVTLFFTGACLLANLNHDLVCVTDVTDRLFTVWTTADPKEHKTYNNGTFSIGMGC